MKKTITRNVADHWRASKAAHNNGGQYSTDGLKLYSYELQIGDTTDEGLKVLRDYSAQGRHGFRSMTTSKHVGYARPCADIID